MNPPSDSVLCLLVRITHARFLTDRKHCPIVTSKSVCCTASSDGGSEPLGGGDKGPCANFGSLGCVVCVCMCVSVSVCIVVIDIYIYYLCVCVLCGVCVYIYMCVCVCISLCVCVGGGIVHCVCALAGVLSPVSR